MDSQKKDPLYKSFGYAFEGIGTCIKKERNMKIHCAAAILVVIAGVILKISSLEWCICLTLFGLIMALELVSMLATSLPARGCRRLLLPGPIAFGRRKMDTSGFPL